MNLWGLFYVSVQADVCHLKIKYEIQHFVRIWEER